MQVGDSEQPLAQLHNFSACFQTNNLKHAFRMKGKIFVTRVYR
jgi:hypothetical protein